SGKCATTEWAMVPVSDMLGLVLPRRSLTAPLLVGIDGRSRSGKSTLAALIARCIQEVVVVHTDDIAWHHSFFGWSDVLIEGVLRPLRREMTSSDEGRSRAATSRARE